MFEKQNFFSRSIFVKGSCQNSRASVLKPDGWAANSLRNCIQTADKAYIVTWHPWIRQNFKCLFSRHYDKLLIYHHQVENAYIHCCSLSQFIPCQIHYVDTSCIRNEADMPKIGWILWDDHAQKSDDDTPWNHGWSWWSSPSQPSGNAIGIDENPIVQMWGFPLGNVQETFRRCSSTKKSTASVRLVKD